MFALARAFRPSRTAALLARGSIVSAVCFVVVKSGDARAEGSSLRGEAPSRSLQLAASASSRLSVAEIIMNNKVVMFSKTSCPYCVLAKVLSWQSLGARFVPTFHCSLAERTPPFSVRRRY